MFAYISLIEILFIEPLDDSPIGGWTLNRVHRVPYRDRSIAEINFYLF